MTGNIDGSFTGKVAFVTGAANGIGRAAALAFAREGASVIIADVSEQGNQETARLIQEAGGRALAIHCDVTRTEEIKAALNKGVQAFGRLDFAFNNAGVEHPVQPAADLTEEQWDRIIEIDLRGVFLCMKHEIPLMLKQGGGAIVNTSSGARKPIPWRSPKWLRTELSITERSPSNKALERQIGSPIKSGLSRLSTFPVRT